MLLIDDKAQLAQWLIFSGLQVGFSHIGPIQNFEPLISPANVDHDHSIKHINHSINKNLIFDRCHYIFITEIMNMVFSSIYLFPAQLSYTSLKLCTHLHSPNIHYQGLVLHKEYKQCNTNVILLHMYVASCMGSRGSPVLSSE